MQPPVFIVNWKRDEIRERVRTGAPLDWAEVFGNDRLLDLEIGIGNGSFLVPFAEQNPSRNMVGIELVGEYVRKADRRLQRAGVTNGRLLVGDAKLLVWRLFADESVENVYINYPDPWFKKKHKKRRLVNSATLQLLARKMRGTLTLATDDVEYRDWVVESAAAAGCFSSEYEEGYARSQPGYLETKYERKWKKMGRTIYYMKFRKTAHPDFDAERYTETQNLRFVLAKLRGEVFTRSVPAETAEPST